MLNEYDRKDNLGNVDEFQLNPDGFLGNDVQQFKPMIATKIALSLILVSGGLTGSVQAQDVQGNISRVAIEAGLTVEDLFDCNMFSSVMTTPGPTCTEADNYLGGPDPRDPTRVIKGECYIDERDASQTLAFGLFSCSVK